jgi:hypothetical protein
MPIRHENPDNNLESSCTTSCDYTTKNGNYSVYVNVNGIKFTGADFDGEVLLIPPLRRLVI